MGHLLQRPVGRSGPRAGCTLQHPGILLGALEQSLLSLEPALTALDGPKLFLLALDLFRDLNQD